MTKQLTALITGASRGIGRAVAVRLASGGGRMLLSGRDQAALELTATAVHAAGGEALTRPADLRNPEAIDALAEWVESEPLDLVVHNAGVLRRAPVESARPSDWDLMLDVDLRAPMQLTARTLRCLIAARGLIVFIGSVAAKRGIARSSGYCAAKHGLDGFAEALFEEVRERGVRVTRIHPGFVDTEMVADRSDIDPTRLIRPEDIAELVYALAHLPPTACATEIVVRPQRSPYRER